MRRKVTSKEKNFYPNFNTVYLQRWNTLSLCHFLDSLKDAEFHYELFQSLCEVQCYGLLLFGVFSNSKRTNIHVLFTD